MEAGLLPLLQAAGLDLSTVAVVLVLWRISSVMLGQKEALIKLIHELDKRVTRIEADGSK